MPKNNSGGYQKQDNSKMMHTADWQQPESTYSQRDGNNTLSYMSRTDATATKQASQIRSQQYKGKY